jgi:hypothetical protein
VAWAGFAFLYYGTIMVVTHVFATFESEEMFADGGNASILYNFDYAAILVACSAEFFGTTLAVFTVDSFGRIRSQLVSYLCGGLSVFTLRFLAYTITKRAVLMVFAFLARLFMMSATCTTWVSTAEILTTVSIPLFLDNQTYL